MGCHFAREGSSSMLYQQSEYWRAADSREVGAGSTSGSVLQQQKGGSTVHAPPSQEEEEKEEEEEEGRNRLNL